MEKLYALIQAASGEDMSHYSYDYTPEPEIKGLYKTKKEALKAMDAVFKELMDDCEEDEVDSDESEEEYKVFVNRDADFCIVLRVQEVEC